MDTTVVSVLALVLNAAVNRVLRGCLVSSGYIPMSGIAGSSGGVSVLNFLRTIYTVSIEAV